MPNMMLTLSTTGFVRSIFTVNSRKLPGFHRAHNKLWLLSNRTICRFELGRLRSSEFSTITFQNSARISSREVMDRLGMRTNQVRNNVRRTSRIASLSRKRRTKFYWTEKLSIRPDGPLYPVKAIHLGQTIDISAVLSQVFPSTPVASTSTPLTATARLGKKKILKNSLVLELPLANGKTTTSTSTTGLSPSKELSKYLAVFRFGSVVCINMDPQEFHHYLNLIRKFVTDPIQLGLERREEFAVMLLQRPSNLLLKIPKTLRQRHFFSIVTADYCVVPALDLDGVAVISHIMGQTVALDTYNDTADDLLNKFATLNSSYRSSSGTFKASDKSFLFKSVAHINAILIDMISKIRLKDRADMAWKISKYEDIHYGLKNEFEIDDRFSQIEYKLNLIQQNSKFFLEVLNSEKSNMLEWAIVWLIVIECIFMCISMSGTGEDLFRYIQSLPPQI